MSTSASVANFYVDRDGHEQPIRFKAADLVNKLAPEGYHWELHNDARDTIATMTLQEMKKCDSTGRSVYFSPEAGPKYDYYICVKGKL